MSLLIHIMHTYLDGPAPFLLGTSGKVAKTIENGVVKVSVETEGRVGEVGFGSESRACEIGVVTKGRADEKRPEIEVRVPEIGVVTKDRTEEDGPAIKGRASEVGQGGTGEGGSAQEEGFWVFLDRLLIDPPPRASPKIRIRSAEFETQKINFIIWSNRKIDTFESNGHVFVGAPPFVPHGLAL